MISVAEAIEIINKEKREYGTEEIPFQESIGRVLAENIAADRDFPPFDRVSMDGIAICFSEYQKGSTKFKVQGLQAAGQTQLTLENTQYCIEIMTGASLPIGCDTVIRYEDLSIENGKASIIEDVVFGQNIHAKGKDTQQGDIIIKAGKSLTAADLAIAATVGKPKLKVKKQPKVLVISSGDELVSVEKSPERHQIRVSNVFAIEGLLKSVGLNAQHLHINDDEVETFKAIEESLKNYDILIITGGVSMGKKDFIPEALSKNGVEKHFHKVAQRPGKPFWFGKTVKNLVFALPGNPVSSFVCTMVYFLPWFRKNMGLPEQKTFVALSEPIVFKPQLTYFLQVEVFLQRAQLLAKPITHNGSGDFINLGQADGFIMLPSRETELFEEGEIFEVFMI